MKSIINALKKEVPFREAPAYSSRRRSPVVVSQGSSLSAPRVLLRSHSDTSLTAGAPTSPEPRCLSPQPPMPSPNGHVVVRTMGGGVRSRSPSLSRVGEGRGRHRQPSGRVEPRRRLYSAVPGRHFVCARPYSAQSEGEVSLHKGDRVKVLSVGEGGFWEGSARGQVGWFPSDCVEEIPVKEDRSYSRSDRTDRRKLFRHYTVGSYDSFDASRDCAVDEKSVVLHKKDCEGFGFVLRGAKADTPIEEFTPTPAFPALQYLESVDEGGVAWQAGLRTGDFLIEVNQENVVKVGHRQVVNMIRLGGNRLLIKVVTVRSLEPDDTRKKAPPPPKRAPTTALSMRSKSMTSELEELDKVEEMTHAQKSSPLDTKIATIKPRPSSRCLVTAADFNSLYHDRQGVAVVPPMIPGVFLGLPEKSGPKKQKSTDDEKQGFLTPPLLKFSRSLSMPDTSEDIPPPPANSPPSPPGFTGKNYATGRGTPRTGFSHTSPSRDSGTISRDSSTLRRGYYRQSSEQFDSTTRSRGRAPVPENPYSEVGKSLYPVPTKPARRKGMLVKQSNVEDSPEKTDHKNCSPSPAGAGPLERTCASIPIPTIIIKEPSTSSSGKSSQGSSMEIEPSTPEHPTLTSHVCGGLRPDDSGSAPNPFAAAIAGAVKDREKRLKAKKNSIAFQSIDMGDDDRDSGGDGFSAPTPRLRQSKSIDEGMFGSDERLRRILAPSASLQKNSITLGKPVGGGNMTDFSSPEPVMVREPLSTRTGQCPNFDSPASLPSASKSHQRTNGTYLHPVTGKPLDPNSPLALALAARDRAMKEQNHPQGHTLSQVQTSKHEVQSLPPMQTGPKTDLNQPLFIDTKLRSGIETSFAEISSTSSAVGRGRGLRRQNTEQKYDSESAREREPKHQPVEERKSAPPELSEAKATGLLMVHTTDTEDSNTPSELKDLNEPESQTHGRRRSVPLGESLDEPVKLPFRIPPPPLASVDIDEEFEFSDPLPPPLEFANSIDVPDDQTSAYAEILLQQRRNGALPPYHHHAPPPVPEHHRRIGHTTTGNSATGNSATGNSATGNSATGNSATGNSVTGNSATENTARGNSARGNSATGTSATGNSAPAAGSLSEHESISAPVLAADSGIEEVDSRSSGDPQHLESTSNVSSISTLSSEGGFCESALDLHLLPERPPVPPKPKGKPVINRSSLYHDALIEEPLEVGELVRTPTQRSSRLWGEPELSSPPPADSTVMTELSSILQHMNRGHSATDALGSPQGTHSYPPRTVDDSGMLRSATSPTPPSSLPSHPHSPILTEPPPHSPHPCTPSEASPITSLTPCSSLPASASPTLTECFSQGGYSLGSSRSPSPLTLLLASNRPFASKPVELWSKGDVADWLDSLNLGEHRDAFLDNEIEGAHLPSLQKEDLIDLGVTRVGHRMNIERALKMLQDR